MKKWFRSSLFLLCAPILIALASVGCGSGTDGRLPAGAVAATKHPLVAEYDVTALQPGSTAWVEFGTDTNYGRQTSPSAPTTSVRQTIVVLVAGMKADTIYHMRAHVQFGDGGIWVDQDRTFKTGALTATGLVPPQIVVSHPTPGFTPSPGVELIDCLNPTSPNLIQSFVTDLDGNIIWYYPGSTFPIKPLANGHFLANMSFDLREIDLAGNIFRDVNIDQVNKSLQASGHSYSITGFHHDFLVLPNGHWIGLANIFKTFTDLVGYPGKTVVISDVLVDVDTSGNVVWAWSAFDHLDINRHPLGLGLFNGGADWSHANGLVYTADGNLLLSLRNQSWILKIDYENGAGSGDIIWRLGYEGDFTLAGGDPRDWFYAQHNPNIVSNSDSQTTLSVWDNGNLRVQPDGSTCGTAIPCYSRPTLFQIDEDAKTAELLWQDRPGLFSIWGGSIEALSTGNVEFDLTAAFSTPTSRVLEVTQTDSPQTSWQLDIGGEYAYRAYRIPSLYPGVAWAK